MEGPSQYQVERAKRVCDGCPVREPCLNYALNTSQAYGVWGGTDPAQRRELNLRAEPPRESVPARPLRGGR
ncbi:WhiB family transcriptional regulator [Nonomuraea sp. NPDC049709]